MLFVGSQCGENLFMKDISNTATVELADAVTDAFNSNDIDRVMSFFAENAVFNHFTIFLDFRPKGGHTNFRFGSE